MKKRYIDTDDEPAPITDDEARSGTVADERLERIVDHPDGYCWIALDGHQQFGPFDTVEEALADMEVDEADFEAAPPSLEEAEDAERSIHQLDPAVASGGRDRKRRVSHPQARVTTFFEVALWSTKTINEKVT